MTNRPERPFRCARCKAVYWSRDRGFHCPACERNARDNAKAIDANRREPELPKPSRRSTHDDGIELKFD